MLGLQSVLPPGQQNRASHRTGLHSGRDLSNAQVSFESLGKPKRVPCSSLCFLPRFPCLSLCKQAWVTEESSNLQCALHCSSQRAASGQLRQHYSLVENSDQGGAASRGLSHRHSSSTLPKAPQVRPSSSLEVAMGPTVPF